EVETVGTGDRAAADAWELLLADGGQDLLAFGTAADGVWQTARLRTPDRMAELAPNHSPAWRGLAVSVLHVLVLDHLFARDLSARALAGRSRCQYVHRLSEAARAVAAGQCALAVLVPPATMAHVEAIAGSLEKMPPKSTYFYPKLLSGLVLNPLRAH